MVIDEELRHRIGLALNEATLHDIKLDKKNSIVTCVFSLITLDKYEKLPDENRFQLVFKPVGRFIASYKKDVDGSEELQKFEPEGISDVIQSFDKQQIYGWDFVNIEEEFFDKWKDELSFDYSVSAEVGMANTIYLFQEYWKQDIDIRIWFDDFEIFNSKNEQVQLEEFLENGKRGWNAIYRGEGRGRGFGVVPIGNSVGNAKGLNVWNRIKVFWMKLVGR